MTTTQAGQKLVDWMDSDMRPLQEFGFDTLAEAVTAIEQEACAPSANACGGCGGPHRFDTSVPSPIWNAVIRSAGLPEYLCASCIVEAFVNAGQSFDAELYGPSVNHGDGTVPIIRVQVDGRPLDESYGDLQAREAEIWTDAWDRGYAAAEDDRCWRAAGLLLAMLCGAILGIAGTVYVASAMGLWPR